MKKLYKIVIAFLAIFCLGFLISYLVIKNKLNEDTKEISSYHSLKIIKNTSKVFKVTF